MGNVSLTSDDFAGIEPKPNCYDFANLVSVAFVARAISEGTPKTEAIQKLRQSKNPEVVVDNGRERGERDKPLNDIQPSLVLYPSSFINIPKRKRSPLMEIVQPPRNTVSSLFQIGKESKKVEEALMMLEREALFGDDVKGKKTQMAKKRIRSDIGCSNEEKARRPMKRKKEEEENCGPLPPPALPQNLRDKIQELNGCELNLVIQKQLQTSDVDDKKYRMSIPIGDIRNEFLRGEEKSMVGLRRENGKIKGMDVELIEPSCERMTVLSLRKWWMNKENGNTRPIYNLVGRNWNYKVVADNGLRVNTVVQLWAFRVEGKLKFALVKLVGDAEDGENT